MANKLHARLPELYADSYFRVQNNLCGEYLFYSYYVDQVV